MALGEVVEATKVVFDIVVVVVLLCCFVSLMRWHKLC